MTGEQLDAILKTLGAKSDKDGWQGLSDGNTLGIYVAHEGASITISRVESLRREGEVVYARNAKREVFAFVRGDIFALSLDSEGTSTKTGRRAGFG
ncbi:MAG: hypothetical protein ABTD50_14470 [Polyangiaceae bacterium]|jgi:hypothetical protein